MITEAELTAMKAASIHVDAAMVITHINEYGAFMFGYTIAELIGKPLSILIPNRDQSKQAAGFHRALNNATYGGADFIVNAQHKNGAEIVIWHKVGKCAGANGAPYFVALAFAVSTGIRF